MVNRTDRRRLRRRAPLRVGLALAAVLLALGASAPAALAHALLVGTEPPRGAVVQAEPSQFVFEFNQGVGGGIGAVRVYDAQGARVDNGVVAHPGGRQSEMAVGLKPGLPHGTYIATYRVVSADTHIVSGGSVFSIGAPSGQGSVSVAGLLAKNATSHVTEVGLGVAKALGDLAIALAIGGVVLIVLAWLPALDALAGAGEPWQAASRAFARRSTTVLAVAVLLGVVSTILGFGFQGADEAGVSFFSAFGSGVFKEVLHSRFGTVWGFRLIAWALFGALLVMTRVAQRAGVPVLRRAAVGAEGVVLDRRSGRPLLLAALPLLAYLAISPALSGHAVTESPRGVLFPSIVVHVLAMSVWLGGLVMILAAVAGATRMLEPAQRTPLLTGVLNRFSPMALGCVIALAITGLVQAYVLVRHLSDFPHTGYGRAVIVKTVALLVLIGLGAMNRERLLPALRRAVAAAASPGRAGVRLRQVLRSEVVLLLGVLGVTAAMVSYAPPLSAQSGPVNITTQIGPAQLEMTVEPATVGANQIHIYLINARDGSPYTATKQLTVTASLPSKGIGEQPLNAEVTGPGHWTILGATLVPGGMWQIQLIDRVSDFDEYVKTVSVPVR
jgi:copper transport protein